MISSPLAIDLHSFPNELVTLISTKLSESGFLHALENVAKLHSQKWTIGAFCVE